MQVAQLVNITYWTSNVNKAITFFDDCKTLSHLMSIARQTLLPKTTKRRSFGQF